MHVKLNGHIKVNLKSSAIRLTFNYGYPRSIPVLPLTRAAADKNKLDLTVMRLDSNLNRR